MSGRGSIVDGLTCSSDQFAAHDLHPGVGDALVGQIYHRGADVEVGDGSAERYRHQVNTVSEMERMSRGALLMGVGCNQAACSVWRAGRNLDKREIGLGDVDVIEARSDIEQVPVQWH